VPQDTGTTDLSRVDPKIGVRYNFTPDLMLYADYSTGFKSGGVNPRPTSPATTGIPFGAEKVQAYEVGFKSEWLNHELQMRRPRSQYATAGRTQSHRQRGPAV
jgi:iron complex outermembrane receptor protein